MTPTTTVSERPTVVLVHGAFADSSSWAAVIARLHAQGIKVTAPANPLRGLAMDSGYLKAILDQTNGPVIAVGHSYGGAVVSAAAHEATNVVGLVFVAAFAPDEGEVLGEVAATSNDSILMAALLPQRYPSANGEAATEFVADPAKFHETFGADLSVQTAAVLAATQRPVADAAFSDRAGAPAWKELPSWAVVATADKAAGGDLTRSMAKRAGSKITEVDGSHLVMLSRPDVVSDVILRAVASVSEGELAGSLS